MTREKRKVECVLCMSKMSTNHKRDLEMYGIIILKLLLEKQNINVWVGFT